MVTIEIPNYLDEKHCPLLYVLDERRLHISWQIKDGRVLSFEHIPENWPGTCFGVHNNYEEWHKAVSVVDWLADATRHAMPGRSVRDIDGEIEVDGKGIEEAE